MRWGGIKCVRGDLFGVTIALSCKLGADIHLVSTLLVFV